MTEREALKLALEALEDNQHLVADNERHAYVMEYNDLIEKCKEALAQPEQEPVAYFNPQVKGGFYWAKPTKITAPVSVNVEPMPLYTTPPQRTWVGLTDGEVEMLVENKCADPSEQIRFVEAKLKEKNFD